MADIQKKTANLFDKDNPDIVEYYTNSQTGVYTYSQNTRSVIIPCQSNKTYSATKSVQGTAPRFCLACYDNYPQENDIATAKVVNNDAMQLTLTTTANSQYLVLFFYYLNPPNASEIQQIMDTLMINEGQPLSYEPYGWVHSLRKLTTATEAVENPLYSDGTAITTYNIKGNEEHTGTPSPSNPVMPNGVGERTENLAHDILVNATKAQYSGVLLFDADLKPDTTYVVHVETENEYQFYSNEKLFTTSTYKTTTDGYADWVITTQSTLDKTNPQQASNGRWNILKNGRTQSTDVAMTNIMITEGSTIPTSYIPYGYKIPITNGQQTTNIYLSEPLYKISEFADIIYSDGTVNRRFRKYVLTGEETVEILSSGNAPIRISGIYFVRPAYTNCTWLCSHYLGVPNSASWSSYNYCLSVSSQDTDNQIRIRDIDRNSGTAEEYKAFLASQYAAGTPVTIWILFTQRTETITVPSIPTAEGANSITVDTTVQPSEFLATWSGWHNAYVKEKSENLIDVEPFTIEANAGSQNILLWSGTLPVGNYTISLNQDNALTSSTRNCIRLNIGGTTYYENSSENYHNNSGIHTMAVPISDAAQTVEIRYWAHTLSNDCTYSNIMLNEGSTAQTYEPYWK